MDRNVNWWTFNIIHIFYILRIKVDINDDTKVYLFAIYWCLQTLATVGYGDVHASNDCKRIQLMIN